jgi:hypothetical protein
MVLESTGLADFQASRGGRMTGSARQLIRRPDCFRRHNARRQIRERVRLGTISYRPLRGRVKFAGYWVEWVLSVLRSCSDIDDGARTHKGGRPPAGTGDRPMSNFTAHGLGELR